MASRISLLLKTLLVFRGILSPLPPDPIDHAPIEREPAKEGDGDLLQACKDREAVSFETKL